MSPLDPGAEPSPFDPPRAGHTAGLWRAWFALCRRSGIGKLRLAPLAAALRVFSCSSSTLGAIAVPTLGFYFLPNPRWRRIGPAVFWIMLFFALTEYARPLGSIAFGLAAAAHGIGAAACHDLDSPPAAYFSRLRRRLCVVAIAVLLLTLAASRLVSSSIIAVAGHDGPLLIDTTATDTPPRADELVAYRIEERYQTGFMIRGGIYFGRVLAAGPDHTIVFDEKSYQIDGVPRPARPQMPTSGSLRTDADHAFIWPEIFHFRDGRRILPAEVGFVAHSALVGRPYKRWFWHTQSP